MLQTFKKAFRHAGRLFETARLRQTKSSYYYYYYYLNRHNSAARWAIFTKYGMEIDTVRPWLPVTSNFTSEKSKMAAAAILKIQLNGHNSIAIAHIRTKFGLETKTDVPKTEIPPNLTSANIHDGGRPPFWKHINRHNTAARWGSFTKFAGRDVRWLDISIPKKKQNGGSRHFESSL